MDRELWNQFAQVLTRHGSDPQNIKFAYSMEELMLQLAFYGGYTILAEPVLAQLPANKTSLLSRWKTIPFPLGPYGTARTSRPPSSCFCVSWILTRDLPQNALTILRKSAALFQKFSKKGLSGAAWRNAKVDHVNQNDPVPDDFTLSPALVDALPALFFACNMVLVAGILLLS